MSKSNQIRDWYDILFDGTEEEISAVKSPNGNNIEFSGSSGSMKVICRAEGMIIRSYSKDKTPNCLLPKRYSSSRNDEESQ